MHPGIFALLVAGVVSIGLGIGAKLLRAPEPPPSRWEELEPRPELDYRPLTLSSLANQQAHSGSESRRRSVGPTAAEVARADAEFAKLTPLLAAISRADKVILFEGLPHQRWEGDLLAQELAAKRTRRIHEFPFYATPLPLGKDDVERVMGFFRDPRLFEKKPPQGMKLCGGFHPDYAVELHVGADTYRVLICLGCYEAKFYGPTTSLYCDLSQDLEPKAEERFRFFRKNRPRGAAH